MSFFADIAGLRPMMPLSELSRLIGPGVQPSAGGWLTMASKFAARIDTQNRIGTLQFFDTFPATSRFDDLHIGMTLDRLLASGHGFVFSPLPRKNPMSTYTGRTAAGDEIIATVGPHGFVRRLDFARSGLVYPDGPVFPGGEIVVPPVSFTDSSAMLSDWAASFTFTEDHAAWPAFAHWLAHVASPDDWHLAAPLYNWDHGSEPLLWIIRQQDCDVATALTIFYLTRPGQMLEAEADRDKVPGYSREAFDLVNEIRRRYLAGFYTRSSIAFDGARAFREEAYVAPDADVAAVDRAIPHAMRAVLPGRVLDEKANVPPRSLPPRGGRGVSKLLPPPLTEEEQRGIALARQAAKEGAMRQRLARGERVRPPG